MRLQFNYSAAAIMVIILPFIVFSPIIFGNSTFISHDLLYLFLPRLKLTSELILSGQTPLWNPYSFAGSPHFADSQAAILHPMSWLSLFFSPDYALDLIILLNFSLAGAGMLFLGSTIGLKPQVTIIASISYMFCGFMVGHLIHPSLSGAAALLPFLVGALLKFFFLPSRKNFYLCIVILAIQILTGHPQVPFYSLLALIAFTIGAITNPTIKRSTILCAIPLLYGVTMLLCAVQLIPLKDFADNSLRIQRSSYEFLSARSLNRNDLALFVSPFSKGSLHNDSNKDRKPILNGEAAIQLWETSGYVGILTLLLALIAILIPSKNYSILNHNLYYNSSAFRISTMLTLLTGLILAFGNTTGTGQILYNVPIVSGFRDFSRALVLICFSLSILAARGLQKLQSYLSKKRFRSSLLISLIITLLTLIDLSQFASGFHKLHPRHEIKTMPDSIKFLSTQTEGRKLTLADSLPDQTKTANELIFGGLSMGYKIRDLNGFSSLQSLRFTNLLYSEQAFDVSYGITSKHNFWSFRENILNLLNVTYLISPKLQNLWLKDKYPTIYENQEVRIHKNPSALKRVHFVKSVVRAESVDILAALINPRTDLSSTAWVENIEINTFNNAKYGDSSGEVLEEKFSNNQIEIRAKSLNDSYLVLNESFDNGWRAWVSGKETPIYRTNYILQGIHVPTGIHMIKFAYQPYSFLIGATVSLLTLLLICCSFFWKKS